MKKFLKGFCAAVLCAAVAVLPFDGVKLSDFFEVTAFAVSDAHGTFGSGLTWAYSASAKTLTISGNGAIPDYTSGSATPWHSSLPSTSTDNVYSISSIIIKEGVTAIGDHAFDGLVEYRDVLSVSLPSTLKTMGKYSFGGCNNIKSLAIPSGVTEIKDYAFYDCARLKAVTLPSTVKTVGKFIGSNCFNLETITFEGVPDTINQDAFNGIGQALDRLTINFAGCEHQWNAYNGTDNKFNYKARTYQTINDSGVLTKVNAISATCTTTGRVAHYKCSGCGKTFSDSSGDTEKSNVTTAKNPNNHANKVTIPAVAATCTDTGLTAGQKCNACGVTIKAQTQTNALGHSYGAWTKLSNIQHQRICSNDSSHKETADHNWGSGTVTTQPTCTATGVRTYTCTDCSATKTETVEKIAHTTTHTAAKAATCTADGNKEYWYCSKCKTYFSNEACTSAYENQTATVDAMLGHNFTYENPVYRDNLDDTHSVKCERCEVYGTTAGHSWDNGTQKTDPTCTNEGKMLHNCKFCSATKIESIAKIDHTEETVVGSAATCTETGLTDGKKCSVCGEITVAQTVIGKIPHIEETVQGKAATCTETGLTDGKKCSVCGEITVDQTVIGKIPHTEETVQGKAATCTETGLTDGKKCSVCGEITVAQTVIGKIPHTEETVQGKAATCTETGLTDGKKCSVCGEITVAQTVIGKIPHAEETVQGKAATCTETGLTDGKKCSVCGEITVAQTIIGKISHTEETVQGKAATCTETGLTDGKKCSVCGEVITERAEIPATGHTNGTPTEENRIEATCTEKGSYDMVVRCTVCGAVILSEHFIIDFANHDFGNDGEDDFCAVCKAPNPDKYAAIIENKSSVSPKCDDLQSVLDDDSVKLGNDESATGDTTTDGKLILVKLQIEDANNAVDEEIKAAQNTAVSKITDEDLKLGMHLDISLLKSVTIDGNSTVTKIPELGKPITITLEIPEKLRGNERIFSIIRVHNGAAEKLNDTDSDPNTITFETDKFSSYSIAYSESKTDGDSDDNEDDTSGSDTSSEPTNSESNTSGSDTSSEPTDREDDTSGSDTSSEPTNSESNTSGDDTSSDPTDSESDTSGSDTSSEPTDSEDDTSGSDTSSEPTDSEDDTSGSDTSSEPTDSEDDTSGSDTSSEPTDSESDISGSDTSSEPTDSESDTSGSDTSSEPTDSESDTSGDDTSSEPIDSTTHQPSDTSDDKDDDVDDKKDNPNTGVTERGAVLGLLAGLASLVLLRQKKDK